MKIIFEKFSQEHGTAIIDIFNYYVENSYSAYPEKKVPYEYYDKFLEIAKSYPAFAIKSEPEIIGFCFLNAYNPLPSFKESAVITYFIDKNFKGKGVGSMALEKLETEAKQKGIKTILANIASLNEESLAFHVKNGFKECGRFEKIINKNGKQFDVVWMQKMINV